MMNKPREYRPISQRWRRVSVSVRFRLMAWNVGVVALTAAAVLLSTREGVRYALYHELDQLHAEDTRQIALMLAEQPLDYPNLYETLTQHAQGHQQHGWFVVLLDREGGVLWSSEQTPAAALSIPAADNYPPVQEVNGIRFLRTSLPVATDSIAALRVGSSLQSIREDMSRVDRQVALAAGVVLLLAPLGGYWLARRATKPLADMIRASVQLRPTRLSERLPLRGTGDELDQLAGTINELLDRIASHVERKQDLLANAAHELRTPLAAIRSSIEVTLNEPRTSEDYVELLDELMEENMRLERLVNQLLLLSETEAKDVPQHLSPVPLHELASRSVEMFRGVAEDNGLVLNCRVVPGRVRGNSDHLRQVINNLLDNAIKFTPPGGRIDVTVGLNEDGSEVRLSVSDTGCGIPVAEQDRVFERFYRNSERTEAAPRGTGLGLSICAAVVAAHGGTVTLQSAPGSGTTVTFTLPALPTSRF